MNMRSQAVLAYCRAGFEADLAAEFRDRGVTSIEPGAGFVVARAGPRVLETALRRELTFARTVLRCHGDAIPLSGNDRVSPVCSFAQTWLREEGVAAISGVRVEFPDTNEGKAQSRLVEILEPRIAHALRAEGIGSDANAPLLHVFLTPDRLARLAQSVAGSAGWRNGIPRLRMPAAAPSRSTLKLAEAFQVFLGDGIERALRPDMRAVDLGAAPGGWTWQFISRGVRVMAIDNGDLKGDLVDNAMVKHLRMDGFRFEPKQAVDWMVCDMVEKPSRIAQLVARWMERQWCTASIFNLKLPMKKRFEEVEKCRTVVSAAMEATGRRYEVRIRQLYHDREEVTGLARFLPRASRNG
ncbi:MAG: 23S rRNA (cytidine(2498)-2'-O)-methyltransferase RlmM [Betaproteobacteria bacterium]|nr:23S rRNA (cytidine(2498)-2'-O)-methyltransferase RlmM [Betaproteobacteria bacterium]